MEITYYLLRIQLVPIFFQLSIRDMIGFSRRQVYVQVNRIVYRFIKLDCNKSAHNKRGGDIITDSSTITYFGSKCQP